MSEAVVKALVGVITTMIDTRLADMDAERERLLRTKVVVQELSAAIQDGDKAVAAPPATIKVAKDKSGEVMSDTFVRQQRQEMLDHLRREPTPDQLREIRAFAKGGGAAGVGRTLLPMSSLPGLDAAAARLLPGEAAFAGARARDLLDCEITPAVLVDMFCTMLPVLQRQHPVTRAELDSYRGRISITITDIAIGLDKKGGEDARAKARADVVAKAEAEPKPE